MPAVFLSARLIGIGSSLSACSVRLHSRYISSSICFTVASVSAIPSTTPGRQYFYQQSLQLHRLDKTYNYVNCIPQFQSTAYFSTSQIMTTNGDARGKRKKSPIKGLDRPAKILKHDSYPPATEIDQSLEESIYNMDSDPEDHISLPPNPAMAANSVEWQETIEKVVRNVVSIRFCQTCSFDTDSSISSEATGFVVDAQKGYILTNRHVVGAGPFWGFCIFDNHEEVS